jgi:hypothetical protein
VANANIASIGRFSSQMLTYLGTQKTVKSVGGVPMNTFKYASGPTTFPSAGSISQADLGGGVVGNYAPDTYNSTKSYFLSRGIGALYADTMTGLAIDMASMLGISTAALLEQITPTGQLMFTADAYRAFNLLRDPGNQVGTVTSVNNRYSLQAREIRA